MIKTEINGNIVHTWSDLGVKIHGGSPEADYDEAYDPIETGRTYEETDIPIDGEETDEATEKDYQNALTELGVNLNEEG